MEYDESALALRCLREPVAGNSWLFVARRCSVIGATFRSGSVPLAVRDDFTVAQLVPEPDARALAGTVLPGEPVETKAVLVSTGTIRVRFLG